MSMLSLGINGSRPKGPPTDPYRIARGLGGYTHRVRSRAPSGEETLPSLTTTRPPLGARGLARAPRLPIYANTPVRPLAPAQQATLAKAQAQDNMSRATKAQGLPDVAPWAWLYQSLPR